uniref:Hypotheticial protein n=1 Tax=Schistosoma japonicum TaxID=6182 RepID=C1LI08_SCHJA|nr:hypotheticial protein [Schistosoma japonicum]CAX74337.1 hypotheticial protein [Schistosoma japonicum]CAX74338.1 hypotheticial protein [Schistosoma japonicum]
MFQFAPEYGRVSAVEMERMATQHFRKELGTFIISVAAVFIVGLIFTEN